MLNKLHPVYVGLSMAESAGLSTSGKIQVKRFDKWMRWIKNARDGRKFTDD